MGAKGERHGSEKGRAWGTLEQCESEAARGAGEEAGSRVENEWWMGLLFAHPGGVTRRQGRRTERGTCGRVGDKERLPHVGLTRTCYHGSVIGVTVYGALAAVYVCTERETHVRLSVWLIGSERETTSCWGRV